MDCQLAGAGGALGGGRMQVGFNSRDIGKYVPEDIGVRLIVNHGAFKLRKRIATVMFIGIEGFTLHQFGRTAVDVGRLLRRLGDKILC